MGDTYIQHRHHTAFNLWAYPVWIKSTCGSSWTRIFRWVYTLLLIRCLLRRNFVLAVEVEGTFGVNQLLTMTFGVETARLLRHWDVMETVLGHPRVGNPEWENSNTIYHKVLLQNSKGDFYHVFLIRIVKGSNWIFCIYSHLQISIKEI